MLATAMHAAAAMAINGLRMISSNASQAPSGA
jgi:hypothetical protein